MVDVMTGTASVARVVGASVLFMRRMVMSTEYHISGVIVIIWVVISVGVTDAQYIWKSVISR